MQQFSRRPWQCLTAHQGAAAPSLGTAALYHNSSPAVIHSFKFYFPFFGSRYKGAKDAMIIQCRGPFLQVLTPEYELIF